MNLLLQAATHNTPFNYFPIALQLVIAIGFVIVMMAVTHLLGPKRKTEDKLINFESGIPSVGNARQPMGIKYFLVAILFVLFSSWLFLGSFPWSMIDKILSLVLIVVLYKVLSREARRYRQMAGSRFFSRAPH